ncbi:hypothetical protein MiTs_03688 [Microcystis aeruginosa NIES-2521]|uniref:Uncharacterized protein n=1 Tax=Microcystis aeruginosa NIES-2521 TaxID=2303983 RepID=A0A5A5S431_MICAE|nr:hypothetical protein MiTs_03688 [Microcystis aeruginosa NIES-2521]
MTRTVPAAVPSLFHNSVPLTPSSAVKYRVLPTAVRLRGSERKPPGRISLTRTVPAAVPSLFHNSSSKLSVGVKNRVLPTAVRLSGLEEPQGTPPPGQISLTRTVPAAVPSLFHNSKPLTPSLALKNRVLPTAVRRLGLELEEPGRISLTRTVLAAVPLLFHNSKPLRPSRAVKNRVLPIAVRE